MSLKTFRFYDARTGVIHGNSVSTDVDKGAREFANANAPAGHVAFLVAHGEQIDPLSQRFDLVTGELVDHKPEQPSEHHEWSAGAKRWQLTASRAEAERANLQARGRIQWLETMVQQRALREACLGIEGARRRLADLDAQITELRKSLL